jgi:hypothetical protein
MQKVRSAGEHKKKDDGGIIPNEKSAGWRGFLLLFFTGLG